MFAHKDVGDVEDNVDGDGGTEHGEKSVFPVHCAGRGDGEQ